jgi:hypothetical protein
VLAVAAWVGVDASAKSTGSSYFTPGNLLVSRSVYNDDPANVQVGMTLPPGCTSGCVAAIADGTYPQVFNNNTLDGSFGITAPIFLDQLTPSGARVNSLEVPNSCRTASRRPRTRW